MKHQNGYGSIVCLDKTGKKRRKPYAVRITTSWKDGKQQRKYLGYYKNQKDARLALAEYNKKGFSLEDAKLTLNEVYDRWISRIENTASENVLAVHKMAQVRFNELGNKELNTIKADHLQDWMDNIDLKADSKKRLKSTMTQLYNYAIKNDLASTNYAKFIEIKEKTEKKGIIFTTKEIETLWSKSDNPVAQWILILIYTGMRIGELLSITADTIYLEKGYMIGGSKSEAGIDRVIPLHNDIIPLVEKQLGTAKQLIRDDKGRKLTYIKSLRLFKSFMEDNGLNPNHLPHDTHKTAVSLMYSAGIPMETIRVIVGHSGKGVTETVYLYKEPTELVEIINTLEISK